MYIYICASTAYGAVCSSLFNKLLVYPPGTNCSKQIFRGLQ